MSRELVTKVAINSCVFFLVNRHYALIINPGPRSAPGCTSIPTRSAWSPSTTSGGRPSSPSPGSCPPPQPQQRDEEPQLFISTLGEPIWAPGQQEPQPRTSATASKRQVPGGPLLLPPPCGDHAIIFIQIMARLQHDPDDGVLLLPRHCDPSRNISAIFTQRWRGGEGLHCACAKRYCACARMPFS